MISGSMAMLILCAITTILHGVAMGTVKLTNVVPPTWEPYVLGWAGMLAFINQTFLTIVFGMQASVSHAL